MACGKSEFATPEHATPRFGYERYMDDFILFSDGPEELKQALMQIEGFVQQQLDLNIKPQSVQFNRVSKGIPYIGYRN